MGYDDRFDRRQDDALPPRRPSRPRGDEGGYDPPHSGSPSRPRQRDDIPPMPPRRSRPRDDAQPPPPRVGRPHREPMGRAESRGARDLLRRVRDRVAHAYDSMSGWLQPAEQRRFDRRARPPSYEDSAGWSWDEGSNDAPPSPAPRRPPLSKPAPLRAPPRSLTRQLINRRRKLRGTRLGAAGVVAITFLALLVIVGGGMGSGYAYALTQRYDQRIIDIGLSRALQTSRIYDRNGVLLYQTFGQTDSIRDYLDYCEIPRIVKTATVDTEDNTFWSDPGGINVQGLLRAVQVDLTHSGSLQGGSGIAQQLVKLEVLSDESQNLGRKIDEAILATDLTRHYTRQDILMMYLNIIPYGFVYEGIEAAAQNYFQLIPKKNISLQTTDPVERAFLADYLPCMRDRGEPIPAHIEMSAAYQLQPWQAMLLAGVPNSPTDYNPYHAPEAAVQRMHDGVLLSMVHNGDAAAITLNGHQVSPDTMSAYVLAQITHTDKKGRKDRIFANRFQRSSNAQSQELAPFFVDYVIQKLSALFPNGEEGFDTAGWNVYTTLDYGDPSITDDELGRIHIDKLTGRLTADHYDAKKEGGWLARVGLQQYAEFVAKRNIRYDYPDYWYCTFGLLSHVDQKYGIDYNTNDNPFSVNQPSCEETALNLPGTNVHDAALTAIDPRNGDILAMVGGVDYTGQDDTLRSGGQNNITISPNRSMGSSFKPIVYATAMQMGWYPGLVIRDQPTCFPASGSSEAHPADGLLCPGHYLPHNDEYWHWAGPEPLRILLGNSLNTPAELALSFVGLQGNASPLMSMAQRLGITTLSAANLNYATAIGTQPVPLLQLTSAYGTFANQGYHVPPRFALSITRADGLVIVPYNPHPSGWQAISAQSAFMITSMLDDNNARVADFGPDNPLHFQGRDVAAKTGTSDALKDIVTMGYTPWLSLGVWAGNANSESAKDIIGIAGAGYIFHDVMAFAINRLHMPGTLPSRFAAALDPQPGGYFPVPAGMHRAILNCNTGLAPWKGMDVLSPKSQCDPQAKDRVPPVMTTEFAYCFKTGGVPPIDPNEKWKCSSGDETPKQLDEWENMGWGNTKNRVTTPGIDVSWMIDGQDPLTW